MKEITRLLCEEGRRGNIGKINPDTSLVSVIVPVYNGEEYIEECICSLVSQTYRNLEIIVVNDGSVDGSIQKCERYRQKDSRIYICNQENRGVSAARNRGIKEARGKYISFVDADDYVESYFIENLIKVMPQNGIAICGYKRYEGNQIVAEYKLADEVTIELIYRNIFAKNIIACGCWNKLFSADVIRNNSLCFDEKLHIGEDMVFLAEYLKYVQGRFAYIPTTSYVYRRNAQSIMQTAYHEKRFDLKKYTCIDAVDRLTELSKETEEEYIVDCFSYRAVRSSLWLLFQMICGQNNTKEILCGIGKRIRRHIHGYLRYKEGSRMEHVAALLTCTSSTLVYVVGRMVHRIRPEFFDKYLN